MKEDPKAYPDDNGKDDNGNDDDDSGPAPTPGLGPDDSDPEDDGSDKDNDDKGSQIGKAQMLTKSLPPLLPSPQSTPIADDVPQ